ncbi:hypothetical protein ElyMa_006814600 [Elysia marginata]|uniref:Uncharacterized protein n=1 Tax=Elysia marginata TaxID=1093978 RepID=A0AAV4J6J6_9GAST|nr:hypothetical protein ElyMa_006814600 [Elysia marginata]
MPFDFLLCPGDYKRHELRELKRVVSSDGAGVESIKTGILSTATTNQARVNYRYHECCKLTWHPTACRDSGVSHVRREIFITGRKHKLFYS